MYELNVKFQELTQMGIWYSQSMEAASLNKVSELFNLETTKIFMFVSDLHTLQYPIPIVYTI